MRPLQVSNSCLLSLAAAILLGTTLQGDPNRGVNCASCHTSTRTDRMQVTPQALKIDLGTQLDGSTRGSLNAFKVAPGGTVQLSMDVLNGTGTWAAQLKSFEKGGQKLNLANKLVWTQTGNTGWTEYGTTAPWMATSVRQDTAAQPLAFNLSIDAATPPDTYDLIFAIAGVSSGRFYQEQHFYLQVEAPPPPSWAGYTKDASGNVDTGAFLGWIQVSPDHGWVWVYSLNKYIYLPEGFVTQSGGWAYVPR